MPELSIIIPTFNNSIRFIKPCLESVFAQDCKDFEVFVIDNGPEGNTAGFIKENYPQIILIENKENLGACQARNQAISLSKARQILTLDCDIILERDFIRKMIGFARDSAGHIGMFQPKILNMDRKTIYSCGIYLSKLKRFYDIGKGQLGNGQFNAPGYIFGACSAAALYKREMLEQVREAGGYFDQRFFFLAEDVDLAQRAQKQGWKALFYPQAVCYHAGDSSNTSRELRQYLCWRNRKFLLEKCRLNGIKLALMFIFYDFPRLVFLYLTNSYVRNAVLKRDRDNKGINSYVYPRGIPGLSTKPEKLQAGKS